MTLTLLATTLLLGACAPNVNNGAGGGEQTENEWDKTVVENYTYASTLIPSTYYYVEVNGGYAQTIPTSEAHVCVFGCDGVVKVEIDNLRAAIESVVVRPVSKNYTYSHDGSKVTLLLKPYDRVVVEINGDETNPLFVFANPLEVERPQEDDPNVVYFKAGTITDIHRMALKSGQTLYVEGGAIIRGSLFFESKENVRIAGCGVLDSRESGDQAIKVGKTKGLTIENITVLNRDKWTTFLYENDNVLLDNYKVVAVATTHHEYGAENDACDLMGCKNVVVKRGFSYCHDDAFCVKSQKWSYKGEVDNIEFEDCIAWNVGGGNSFEIGYELNQNVNDVRYRNIYAIRTAGRTPTLRRGALGVQNGAGGRVTNISYDGVWVEDPREYGIYMRVLESSYEIGTGVEWTPGQIDGVSVKNANFLVKPPYGFHFEGYDVDVHRLKNITLENITIAGEKLTKSNAQRLGFVFKNADVEIK
ncbi:MAG: hypothetical protein IKD05_03510 [Tidjanibacter sp.]|nr:hypothetical protein [Tidjanibacter sp.]MBR3853720.1 hypothetical protein [Tidjanibacter sp.]MBR7129324.1 hypothetical protein [Tidjanibacter sp.]